MVGWGPEVLSVLRPMKSPPPQTPGWGNSLCRSLQHAGSTLGDLGINMMNMLVSRSLFLTCFSPPELFLPSPPTRSTHQVGSRKKTCAQVKDENGNSKACQNVSLGPSHRGLQSPSPLPLRVMLRPWPSYQTVPNDTDLPMWETLFPFQSQLYYLSSN